jgi:signal transduction histidine kinase
METVQSARVGTARSATRVLNEVTLALASGRDVEARLRTVLAWLQDLVQYDHCVLLCAGEVVQPHLIALPPLANGPAAHIQAALDRLLQLLQDSGAGREASSLPIACSEELGWPSHLALPLVGLDGVIGIVAVFRRSANAYSEMDVSLLSVVAGQLAAYLAALTEHRRAVEARDELDRLRQEFLATTVHDLKTPLTVVRGRAQLLLHRLAGDMKVEPPGLVEALQAIEASSGRMAARINELVDITRQELHVVADLHPVPVDLVELVQRVVAPQQETCGHTLRLEVECPNLIGAVDTDHMARVLENLIGNAAKYSPAAAPLTVRVRREAMADRQWCVISVHDQGIGIPAADLQRVFERYYRAGNVPAQVPGSGIGLASVRHIVEQHGGTVAVESAEGAGSTFTVRLPVFATGSASPTEDDLAALLMPAR